MHIECVAIIMQDITQSAAKASRPYHIPLPAKIKPQPFDGAGDR